MTEDQNMRLTSGQANQLRRLALVQVIIFGLVALTFWEIGIAGLSAILTGTFHAAGAPGLMVVIVYLAVACFLLTGLAFGWLAITTILIALRMGSVKVQWYEGTPDKVVFVNRQSANIGAGSSTLTSPRISGAWLRHDGKKYAVDLDMFHKIPDKGTFRFFYIRRPGVPGLLTPYLIVDFEPVKTKSTCRCMTPPFRTENFSDAVVGIDKTRGRFGDVSIATCKTCGQQWLCYHVEYEAFERSGRWFRGLLSHEETKTVTPETAVPMLEKMDWYFAGGSHFDSTGFKTSGPPAVDL